MDPPCLTRISPPNNGEFEPMRNANLARSMLSGLVLAVLAATAAQAQSEFNYPTAKKIDHTDDYHGTIVADPYRWLEDTDAPDTREWIAAENEITFAYLNSIPEREWIK